MRSYFPSAYVFEFINFIRGIACLGGIVPQRCSQQMIENANEVSISNQIIHTYGDLKSFAVPYLRWISEVWRIAVHVVRNPKPRVNPQAIDAMERSAGVVTRFLKSGGRKVLIATVSKLDQFVSTRGQKNEKTILFAQRGIEFTQCTQQSHGRLKYMEKELGSTDG